MAEHIIGIGLAAGSGVRFRPLTLKAQGYLRAKAAVFLLGRRVLDWLIDLLQQQGIADYIMVTKGKENRYQIKAMIGYGEALGVRVRYSPVSLDRDNTGSGDSLLANLEEFDINDLSLVFPTDSILEIDLAGMAAAHRQHGAVVTIAAAEYPAETIAGRYGLIDGDKDGRVRGFIEKPSLAQIHQRYGVTAETAGTLPPLLTNAGFYLVDSRALREISRHPDVQAMRRRKLDIGGDLLPWLAEHGFPVYAYRIGRMGDLGNIPSYLETMLDVMQCRFPSMTALMPRVYPTCGQDSIDDETMEMIDPVSRLTLREKIAHGLVEIESPVRIGKYVLIYPGVKLSTCNIDDDCEINEGATIRRSSIGAGTIVGPYSLLEDVLTGLMPEIHSTREQPVSLTRYVAIGDEVIIRPGVQLHDSVLVHPRLKIPTGVHVPPNTELSSSDQVLNYL